MNEQDVKTSEQDSKTSESVSKTCEAGDTRPSQLHQVQRKDLVEALNGIVDPLDKILALMQGHQTNQARLMRLSIAVAIIVLCAAAYQWKTTSVLARLEQQLLVVGKTGEETKGKLAETERKVDETKTKTVENSQKIDEASTLTIQRLVEAAGASPSGSSAPIFISIAANEGARRKAIETAPAPHATAAALSPRPTTTIASPQISTTAAVRP